MLGVGELSKRKHKQEFSLRPVKQGEELLFLLLGGQRV